MRRGAASLVAVLAFGAALVALPGEADARRRPDGGALSPPAASDAGGASGRIRLHRAGVRRSTLRVRVRGLESHTAYEIRSADGGGRIGALTTNRRGVGRARFRDADVPGGSARLLAGMSVDVVHEKTGQRALAGDVPRTAAQTKDGGDASGVREAAAVFESDGGVRGVFSIRSDGDGGERMSLVVAGPGMDEDGSYALFLSTGGDSMEDVGELALHEGEKRCERKVEGDKVVEVCSWTRNWMWGVDTADGDSLPLGADGVDDLAGRAFEVRDGEGDVRLKGKVPAFGSGDGDDGGDDDGDDDGGEGDGDKGGECEGSAVFETDGGVAAKAWVRSEDGEGERLAIEVRGLPTDGKFILFLENGDGVLDDVAVLVRDGGAWWYWVNTASGGELPFGADSVSGLAGRAFEVRDGDGKVRVKGELPGCKGEDGDDDGKDDDKDGEGDDKDGEGDDDGKDGDGEDGKDSVREAEAVFESDGGVRCASWIRSDPAAGSERLVFKVTGLPESGNFYLYVANGDGVLDDVAKLVRDGGAWWVWIDTAKGGKLPFGADEVSDLAGRKFEIRDGEGNVRVKGEIPAFED